MVMQYDEIDRRLSHLEADVGALKADVQELRIDMAFVKGSITRLSWSMPAMLIAGMTVMGMLVAFK